MSGESRYGAGNASRFFDPSRPRSAEHDHAQLPVAVIGAGPVGLAAAAHLARARIEPVVFEAGDARRRERARVGPRARLLAVGLQHRPGRGRAAARSTAGSAPAGDGYPTGDEIVERYLEPLAAVPGDRRAPASATRASSA